MNLLPDHPNRLLRRQFDNTIGKNGINEESLIEFLSSVNQSYAYFEDDIRFYNRVEKIAHEELEVANGQLTEKNDLLDAFNHGLAHDVMNHTSNIEGLINMLWKYADRGDTTKIQEITPRLLEASSQLSTILKGFLFLSHTIRNFGATSDQNVKTEMKSLIADIEQQILQLKSAYKAVVSFQYSQEILDFNPHPLRIILVNLISNGIKYGSPTLVPDIKVNIEMKDNDGLLIDVKDNGMGFDPNFLNENGELKFQEMRNSGEKGFGIGLFLVQKIVQHKRGKLEIISAPNKGTTIRINIPKH